MMYEVKIKWNGNVVFNGQASSVFLWENLRMCAAQYGNADKAGLVVPTLVDIANAEVGTKFTGHGSDGTGVLDYTAIAIG